MFDDLIDVIALKAGVMYISDLHSQKVASEKFDLGLFEDIEEEDYSLKQWNDAISYVSGEPREFDNVKEAKKYLIEFFSAN